MEKNRVCVRGGGESRGRGKMGLGYEGGQAGLVRVYDGLTGGNQGSEVLVTGKDGGMDERTGKKGVLEVHVHY